MSFLHVFIVTDYPVTWGNCGFIEECQYNSAVIQSSKHMPVGLDESSDLKDRQHVILKKVWDEDCF